MSPLLVFHRVYRLEIQSVMLVFSTGFVNYPIAPLIFSLVSSPPLQTGLRQIKHLPQSPFTGKFC